MLGETEIKKVDLLQDIEDGGCSAKLPAKDLERIIGNIPILESPALLVGNNNSDDAMVMRLDDHTALIQTTDFFPPICSDPYDFGQIAAANALSDIYAMGGTAITALNLVMYPWEKYGEEVLAAILMGGAEKVMEAGAVLGGGHTIEDRTIKYGLAVTGRAPMESIVTNSEADPGDLLIITKPLGTALAMTGHKIGMASPETYEQAINSMKLLSKDAGEIMVRNKIKSATDITGFGLCGHASEMARGSNVTLEIESTELPLIEGACELIESGCIPGATFRNLKFSEDKIEFSKTLDYSLKMITLDAQTSGGLLMSVGKEKSQKILEELMEAGYEHSRIIGEVLPQKKNQHPVRIL